jgi:hypothetical protein
MKAMRYSELQGFYSLIQMAAVSTVSLQMTEKP